MVPRRARWDRDDCGTAALEFAILTPVFLLIGAAQVGDDDLVAQPIHLEKRHPAHAGASHVWEILSPIWRKASRIASGWQNQRIDRVLCNLAAVSQQPVPKLQFAA